MAFLRVRSENPNLSYVLRKNPASGLMAKPLRAGALFGWFTPANPHEYNIYFKDADNEISYKRGEDESFEYLNLSRYNSSLFVLDALYGFLDSAVKKSEDHDSSTPSSVYIASLETSEKYLDIFRKSFPEYVIEARELSRGNYELTIRSTGTLFNLLNFVALFGVFNAIQTDSLGYIEDSQVAKYMNCLQILDAPYLIRYVFKINFFRGKNLFLKYREALMTTKHNKLDLLPGSACDARLNFVAEQLSFHNNILDIGCGEGTYLFKFAKKLELSSSYHGVDTNKELVEEVRGRIEKKELENTFVYESLDEYLELGSESLTDVLLIEVIEHMTQDEAAGLIKKVIEKVNYNKILITTPNKEFSKFYCLGEGEVRHEDHKFELTRPEFEAFMSQFPKATTGGLGDSVDGIQPHHYAVISK